ncbi:MAG: hypothetical protein SFY80_07980 [Verrucomicrobiota bacterium]|nr:hypothetical protein [Verrucomicrobiota bacterium]
MTTTTVPYKSNWFTRGDINGFFGLMVDNLAVMAFLATVLVGVFQFPADFIFLKMFPGTALGVLVGDLIYTWMAIRLGKQTGRSDVTAMPLGIDTPSTIGMGLLVLGPAFLHYKQAGMGEHEAAMQTWYLGMAAMVIMGMIKLALSYVGGWVGRVVPRAGLLGSIAAIALVLIGFFPIIDIMRVPVVGFTALLLVLYTVVAKGRLPWGIPGVLGAFIAGVVLYFTLGPLGLAGPGFQWPAGMELRFALPVPTLGFISGMADALGYLALIVPFALLVVVGGINVTESAHAVGDSYRTRDILLTEAISTLAAGLCGGVAQTTPYIGHPAYKKMGARAGYTLLTGLFIGLGGVLGYIANAVELIPLAVLAPILIFVSLDITVQAFQASPAKHAIAVVFSFFPAIARMVTIKLGDPTYVVPETFTRLLGQSHKGLPELAVIMTLGNGFIITSMLWGSFLAEMIDRRLRNAALYLAIGGALSFFGIIHSVRPDGGLHALWQLHGMEFSLSSQFTLAYFASALVCIILSLQPRPWEQP